MADSGKVPSDLILSSSLPLGIRAYRRRFQSPCTNLQKAGPDDYVNIYPDTSTPGAFIDPESTYLTFDFQVLNKHFCVDYANWGVEGVGGAIIQDWRVYNQGSILEEILDYGTAASCMNNLEGAYQQEVHMYLSAKLKNTPNDEFHRNFIKPPMVDRQRNIMYGPNPFGLGMASMPRNSLYTNKYGNGVDNFYGATQFMMGGGISFMNQVSNTVVDIGAPGAAAQSFGSDTTNPTPVTNDQLTNMMSAPYINTLMADTAPTWTLPDTLSAINSLTPMDFPDYFCPDMVDIVSEYVREYGSINKPQIMANLCNVKCFPIGCKSKANCWNAKDVTQVYSATNTSAILLDDGAAQPTAMNPTYRICYRPFSGIFGKMATKMLATTLLAPQQLYINLHLARAEVALNLSSDPCRRIAGTIRDYVRNMGKANGKAIDQGNALTIAGATAGAQSQYLYGAGSTFAPGYHGGYCIQPLTAAPQNYTKCSLSTIFSTAAASGKFLALGLGGTGTNSLNQSGGFSGPVPPAPQYCLSKNPWLKKAVYGTGATTTVEMANELECFYGTYLAASVPQSARIFDLSYDGATTGSNPTSFDSATQVSYELTNINLVGDQLILPNETTADIIAAAEAGQYNVHTNSLRTYTLQITPGSTQTIICPLKVNMAKRILFVFQNTQQRNDVGAYRYDSNCGLNPFALVQGTGTKASIQGHKALGGTTTQTIYGVGYTDKLTYTPTSTKVSDIQVQLRIGNDFYPPQPLTTMQEISAELCKTMEGWQNSAYSPEVDGNVLTQADGTMVYDCLEKSKFVTAFVPNDVLDDQTIVANYDMAPLWVPVGSAAATSEGFGTAADNKTSKWNGYNYICPRGYCLNGTFTSPSSRFVLGFNMRSFKSSDGVDGGTYLGNNTITLQLKGAVGLSGANQTYRGVAIIPHRVAMRYSPGGQLVWAY